MNTLKQLSKGYLRRKQEQFFQAQTRLDKEVAGLVAIADLAHALGKNGSMGPTGRPMSVDAVVVSNAGPVAITGNMKFIKRAGIRNLLSLRKKLVLYAGEDAGEYCNTQITPAPKPLELPYLPTYIDWDEVAKGVWIRLDKTEAEPMKTRYMGEYASKLSEQAILIAGVLAVNEGSDITRDHISDAWQIRLGLFKRSMGLIDPAFRANNIMMRKIMRYCKRTGKPMPRNTLSQQTIEYRRLLPREIEQFERACNVTVTRTSRGATYWLEDK